MTKTSKSIQSSNPLLIILDSTYNETEARNSILSNIKSNPELKTDSDKLSFINDLLKESKEFFRTENWRIHLIKKMSYEFGAIEIGMGATIHLFSDSHAVTIIKISKNKKKITVRRDKAILDPNFKPEFVPGGFSAHCTNQGEQSYTYEENTQGSEEEFSLRKSGRWIAVGQSDKYGSIRIGIGYRRSFHDYNF